MKKNEVLDSLWESIMMKSVEMYLQNSDYALQMQLASSSIQKEKITKKHEKVTKALASEWADIKSKITSSIKGEKDVKNSKK